MKKPKKRPRTMAGRTPREIIEEHATKLLSEMHEEVPPVKVPDRLAALGDIYRERNGVYGDTYKNFGHVMKGFFREPVTIETAEDWNRLALFFHCADKLARYAGAFARGGHVDSLDDNSVYSQMLQEYDHDVRTKNGDGQPE